MKFFTLFFCTFFLGVGLLSGCFISNKLSKSAPTTAAAVIAGTAETQMEAAPVMNNLQTPVPALQAKYDEKYALQIEKKEYNLSKYEPVGTRLSGAYILSDKIVNGSIEEFEEKTGVENALYSCNITLGGNAYKHILECISAGKTPFVTINPPTDYEVFDLELLKKTAKEIGTFQIPVFVQIYPYSKALKFRQEDYTGFLKNAKDIFRDYAPQAALVWSVYYEDVYDSSKYYPGDEFTDWVGISIFDNVTPEGGYKDMLKYLDFFYYTYQKNKPIMITELAVSHYEASDNTYYTKTAAEEITKLYTAFKDYPRVRGIIYMNYNAVEYSGSSNARDYSITQEEELTVAFQSAILTGNFGSIAPPPKTKPPLIIKSPFPAYLVSGEYFIAHKSLQYDMGYKDIDLLAGKEVVIEGEKYYPLKTANMVSPIDFYVNPAKALMVLR